MSVQNGTKTGVWGRSRLFSKNHVFDISVCQRHRGHQAWSGVRSGPLASRKYQKQGFFILSTNRYFIAGL
jgi:hypothetical protein